MLLLLLWGDKLASRAWTQVYLGSEGGGRVGGVRGHSRRSTGLRGVPLDHSSQQTHSVLRLCENVAQVAVFITVFFMNDDGAELLLLDG